MAIRARLTTLDAQTASAKGSSDSKREISEEEKAQRKDRVAKAKDALARSIGVKGEQVAPARTALKLYLQKLNDPKQPSDEMFESLIEAPFKAPKKEKPRR